MVEIVLSPEQTQLLESNAGYLPVRASGGQVVGYLAARHFTAEKIARAEQRLDSPGPWYTTEQVLNHLRSVALP